MSPSSDAALQHLRQIKPTDGWKVEIRKGTTGVPLVRLSRRGVPVTDSYFLDVVYDAPTNQVVGILAAPKGGKAQAQVLVDQKGKPVSGMNLLGVRYPPVPPSSSSSASTQTTRTTTSRSNNNTAASPTLTDAQNRDLLFYGGSAIAAAVVFRLVFNAMFGLYVLAFPLVYLYLVLNCPTAESFDAKKELKRILRGHHLPENHPQKPKGVLEEAFSRIQVRGVMVAGVFLPLAVSVADMDCSLLPLMHFRPRSPPNWRRCRATR